MKYLIAGLGNPGEKYRETRHNIGFEVLDLIAEKYKTVFSQKRYGDVAEINYRGRKLVLLKPSTYMNLSGKAIRYWSNEEKIPLEKILVITDDVSLPAGKLRLKKKGSSGGHNGLEDIIQKMQTSAFSRLRFGVGSEYSKGKQIDYVLGKWSTEEKKEIDPAREKAAEMVHSYVHHGPDKTMSLFN